MKGLHIYKASAGSGKTYTLALQFVLLILKNERPDAYREVLAMTFTNKAAGEMKERILDFLHLLSKDSSGHSDLSQQVKMALPIETQEIQQRAQLSLQHILHNYSDLSILTLDKFIQNVIKSFTKELDFAHQYKIESNSDLTFKEAIDELLGRFSEDSAVADILRGYSLYKARSGKSYKLEIDLLNTARHLSKESSEGPINTLKELSIDDFSNIIENHQQELNKVLNQLQSNARSFSQLLGSQGLSYKDIKKDFAKVYNMARPQKEISSRINFTEKQLEAIDNRAFCAKSSPENIQTAVKSIEEPLADILKNSQALIHQYNYLSRLIPSLYNTAVLNEINQILNRIKAEQNLVFFIDFNRLASSIIRHEPVPFIYEKTGARYKHLMLDEFQDTSENQWHNLLPIMIEALSKNGLGLIVGDEKQAIYRWRNGNVEQFMQLPQLSIPSSFDPTVYNLERYAEEITQLPYNYRSKKELVDFNNRLFERLKNRLGDFYKTVYDHTKQLYQQDEGGYVAFSYINKDQLKSAKEVDLNLKYIQQEIHSALQRGYDYKDIAILTRQKKEAATVANFILKELKIPVVSPESLRIDAHPAVRLLIHYLKHLSHPAENVYRIGVLKHYADYHQTSYNDLVKLYTKTSNKKLLVDISSFLYSKQLVNTGNRVLSISALIRKAAEGFGIKLFEINVQFFLNSVHLFEKDHTVSISSFLKWWQENGEQQNINVPEGYNAVKIMTIHASKGLEFPICFLPFINWKDTVRGEFWLESEELNEKQPVLMNYSSKSSTQTSIEHKYEEEKHKVELDQLNLLYVACTRAREEMYIVSSGSLGEELELAAKEYMKEEEGIWTLGQKSKKFEGTGNHDQNRQELKFALSSVDQVEFSTEAPKKWDSEELMDEQSFGIIAHQVLANIKRPEDLPKALETTLGPSMEVLKKELSENIQTLFQDPSISALFQGSTKHYSETQLTTREGKTLRPDKVIEHTEGLVVLEYKTGDPNKSHQHQLIQYGELLSSITKKNVDLYLIYLRPVEIIKLSAHV